ncbi:Ig-like domain-containing protein [Methylomicrobium lacus]|uniref:Ig-like domain-containing protein n=1 Tax=Methylomicrobium lacus TaxID=136992 RepID=UPI0035A88A6B
MHQNHFYLSAAATLALLTALNDTAIANPGVGRMYGKDAPFQVRDLPAQSRLRKALEKLPSTARKKAMKRLHEFSFPANDANTLQVDQEGGVFYIDAETPAPESATSSTITEGVTAASALPAGEVFKLHSLPGASRTVFLDFDGHVISGTAWNSTYPTLTAVPYDTDGDASSFSDNELNRIHEIWHRVAEDFAPFNIDVTTEIPAVFGPTVGRVLITQDVDQYGLAMPSQGAGGVAYVNVFGRSDYATKYSPALVYYNHLGLASTAEASSHEFGHNLGLSHDGTSTASYYSGLGSGYSSWAPIMGASYYKHVTEWSKGEYPDANNTQDDISIIATKLTFKADDHGNTNDVASLLAVESDGSILATTPQDDPGNTFPANKGIIETKGDVDVFALDVGAGTVNISVTPAWAVVIPHPDVTGTLIRGANLDVKATLYDASGFEIGTSDPLDNTNAVINTSVSAGRYYLAITGVGNSSIPYSSYGSEGEFFITGTVPPVSDTTPPAPNPDWKTAPAAQNDNSIAMESTVASDASGTVEYQFSCIDGGTGCVNSAWQASPNYVISGLAPATSYTFQVKARDAFGNQTPASSPATATTAASINPNPVANDDTASVEEDGTTTLPVLSNDSVSGGNSLSIVSVGTPGHGVATINNDGTIAYKPSANFYGSDSFTYTISDGIGGSASATVNITVNPVNDAPVAVNDTATVRVKKTVSINVLSNDSDVDADTLSIISTTKGKIVNGQTLSYTGTAIGTDTFTYTVSDGKGGLASASVTVTVKR